MSVASIIKQAIASTATVFMGTPHFEVLGAIQGERKLNRDYIPSYTQLVNGIVASECVVDWGAWQESPLGGIVRQSKHECWSDDIRNVRLLGAINTTTYIYYNLDDFCSTNEKVRSLAMPETAQRLEELISDIQNTASSMQFYYAGWDRRLTLSLSNCNHRFAAARRLAIKLGQELQLHAPFRCELFDRTKVQDLLNEYDILAVSLSPSSYVDISRNLRVMGGLCVPAPRPCQEHSRSDIHEYILFIPKAGKLNEWLLKRLNETCYSLNGFFMQHSEKAA